MQFDGSTFYEYHKAFAAKAVALLLNYGINVDWGKWNNVLFCTVFAGHKANASSICNSLGHATHFCPQAAKSSLVDYHQTRSTAPSGAPKTLPASNDRRGRPIEFALEIKKFAMILTVKGDASAKTARFSTPVPRAMAQHIVQRKCSSVPAQDQANEKCGTKNASRKPTQWVLSKPTPIKHRQAEEREISPCPYLCQLPRLWGTASFHTGEYEPPTVSTLSFAATCCPPYPARSCRYHYRRRAIRKGFIIGPFDQPPFKKYRVSPIGVVN